VSLVWPMDEMETPGANKSTQGPKLEKALQDSAAQQVQHNRRSSTRFQSMSVECARRKQGHTESNLKVDHLLQDKHSRTGAAATEELGS
jgi:hypothetical protein